MVKCDQEPSILEVRREVAKQVRLEHGIEILPEDSKVGSSQTNASAERAMWEMQSKTRSLMAYCEWVHGCSFESTDVITAWAVEYSGQMISRNQRHV